MTTRLRLHRGDSDEPKTGEARNIRFPSPGMRTRLVAGRVPLDPVDGAPEDEIPRLTLHTEDGERPIRSEDLIAQIESTIDRIQERLDQFSKEVDRPFKFPGRGDDDWPPRAA